MDFEEIYNNLISSIDFNKLESEILNFESAQLNLDFSKEENVAKLKEYNKYTEILKLKKEIQEIFQQIKDNSELSTNIDFAEMAAEELKDLTQKIETKLSRFELLNLKPLENDDKKAIFEIRPGVGGVEAALFAEKLFGMYQKFCQKRGYKIEIFNVDYNPEGGITEGVFLVDSAESFGEFRFESGVHRVQRVPVTEALGRIHTSTASVVVMPEISLSELKIEAKDIRIDVYRSSGPGGQSVNTTDSAVRITHLPSKITVTSQQSKSQHKNKELAMIVLVSKLSEIEKDKISASEKEIRDQSIKGGDRSSKIRTYNFPQGRITDHRIQKSWFNITQAVEGDLEIIITEVNKELRK